MLLRISITTFLLTFILTINFSYTWKKSNFNEPDIKLLIDTEMTSGTTKEEVLNFLVKKEILHSNYSQDLQNNYDFNSPKFDGKREPIIGFIVANIPNIRRTLLLNYELQIFFYFDSKGKLVGHSIRTVGMGF